MAEHETEPAARSRCLPKYTIFVSYSAKEKAFAEQLCEDLQSIDQNPFFYQNSDCVPRGGEFASRILSGAEECLLALVLLSEGYLRSKWSMLELSTLVKSRKTTNPNLKLFPLFYKLSPSDLRAEKVETIWRASWEKLVKKGKVPAEEIVSFSDAVRELRAFNGLEYRKHETSIVKYRAAVVREVYNNVPPIKTDDFQGYERLCEITSRMFEEGTSDYICMERCYYLGLYGLGRVGKSLLCRAMCSYFQAKYRVRACHVELPTYAEDEQTARKNRISRLKHILQELTDINTESLDSIVTESQGLSYLKDRLSSQPVFIAVANVGDSESSLDEARGLVMAVVASGSKIMVTSRNRATLRSVFYADKYCKPTPRLEVEAYEVRESSLSVAAPKRLLCRLQSHRGRDNLEAELHVIDMVYADIPLDLEATTFEVIMQCLITLAQGIEAQVAESSRLHSGKHIHVFNHECVFLVNTLCGTVHGRLRRYNNTLSLVQVAGVSDRRRIFMSVAFCTVALAELERMFKAVVDLLTMCTKKDWWNTALELSNALPSPTIPRWSIFSLAIQSCEWSMDIADFGFHALEQFLDGASTVTGVVFK